MPYMSAITASTQLKITIPDRLLERVRVKSEELGLKPTSYIRHLIISDLDEDRNLPKYQLSPQYAEFLCEQMKEYESGKTKKITDVDEFMATL